MEKKADYKLYHLIFVKIKIWPYQYQNDNHGSLGNGLVDDFSFFLKKHYVYFLILLVWTYISFENEKSHNNYFLQFRFNQCYWNVIFVQYSALLSVQFTEF